MVEPVAFAVHVPHLEGLVTVAVTGEVDISTAPTMPGVLLRALDGAGADLVVDRGACGFIDCAGLGVPVGVANQARAVGAGMSLHEPSPWLCRVRDLAGLGGVLPTEGNKIPAPTT